MDYKQKGQDGEDFVNAIAFKTFLKHWCFPNPLDILGDNKEICDLLIVFDSTCIIISVKNYAFKGNYVRYTKNTVEKAMRQISGAERKLFRAQPIFLKHPDREIEEFKKEEIKKNIRIIVNVNPALHFYQTSYHIDGKDYTVMDANSWEHSISEMDTLPDFINYIEKRCSLFRKFPAFILPNEESEYSKADSPLLTSELEKVKNTEGLVLISGSELDLIATYVSNKFSFPKEIEDPSVGFVTLKIDGQWTKYEKSAGFKAKKQFEFLGGFIDKMVKEMIINQTNGGRVSKLFFQLNRMQRSTLAEAFLTFHQEQSTSGEKIDFHRRNLSLGGFRFILIFFDDDYPREELENHMYLCLEHYNYLLDFKCEEIGLIAVSKSFLKFAFAYFGKQKEYTIEEITELIGLFKHYGMRIEKL